MSEAGSSSVPAVAEGAAAARAPAAHRRFGATWIAALCSIFLAMTGDAFLTIDFKEPPDGDSMYFLPQAVSFARGEGLRNTIYKKPLTYSPAGDGRHIWHGFLYQMTAGSLPGASTYPGLSRIIAAFNALTLGLVGWAGYAMVARVRGRLGWSDIGLGTISLVALVGYLQGLIGRPETLSVLLIAFGVWSVVFLAGLRRAVALGLVPGALFVTSPVQGPIAAVLVAGVLLMVEREWKTAATRVLLAGAISIAVVVGAFAIYPYGVAEWVDGVRQHAAGAIKPDFTGVHRLWLIAHGRFFQFGTLVAALAGLFVVMHGLARRERLIATATSAVFLAYVYQFGAANPYYNFTTFMPLYVMFVFAGWGMSRIWSTTMKRRGAWTRAALLGAVSVVAMDPIGELIWQIGFRRGPGLIDGRQRFAEVMAGRSGGSIALTKGLFTLADDHRNLDVLIHEEYAMNQQVATTANVLVVQQVHHSEWKTPPTFANFQLVRDDYVPWGRSLFPLRWRNDPHSYAFALYERSGAAASRAGQGGAAAGHRP